jgi:carbamoyl-phosphate synthase small subunit
VRGAVLALEDGTTFEGVGFGADATTVGEVCFNTGMTGYQEVLTDPSYHGQIVVMTAPQIGNTGVNLADEQSRRPQVAGFAVRDPSWEASSWRATNSLDAYLADHGIPGIADIDTRRLTRHLRSAGALRGTLATAGPPVDELVDRARAFDYLGRDLVAEVSVGAPYFWRREDLEERAAGGYVAGAELSPGTRDLLEAHADRPTIRVAALDYGIKTNSLDLLAAVGCTVTVWPAATPASEILDGNFTAVFLSNGPGNPESADYAVSTTRGLLGRVPVFGICLGHQILGLALGAKTYKLPFGHHGSNHPVKRTGSDRIEITCQNHGFAVDPESLEGTGARVTHFNLNDHTIEGLEAEGLAFSVQYHPEAGPGPHDSRYLFEHLRRLVDDFEPTGAPESAYSR